MMRLRTLCAVFAAVILVPGAAFADPVTATFNFDGSVPGTATPFNITNNGVIASFSSPDGAVFSLSPAFFFTSPLQGNVLGDLDPALHTLVINFNRALNFVRLDFALDTLGSPAATLSLAAFLGANAAGSATATATFPPAAFFPQGSLEFGGTFDSIRLTSTRQNFAIDNLTVAAPEPGTFVLLGIGLVGTVLCRKIALRSRR